MIDENSSCQNMGYSVQNQSAVVRLDEIYPLFNHACYSEVIQIGNGILFSSRDKFYSVSREVGELAVNEGQLTDYVMESFERAHLSYLMALSYLKLSKREDAKVELRRSQQEMNAKIYKSGEDVLNSILIGNLWERLGDRGEAIVSYRKARDINGGSEALERLAKERIELLEKRGPPPAPMHVFAVGEFPNIIYWTKTEYEQFYPVGYPLRNCSSQTGFLVDVIPWTKQISARSSDDRMDQVSSLKQSLRAPATWLYTGAVIGIGAGLAILAAGPKGDAQLAGAIGLIALFIARRTYAAGNSPDMRYWSELPGGFLFSKNEDFKLEPCIFQYLSEKGLTPKIIF